MTITPRKRVARGVRDGGQFAVEQRTETSVSLLERPEATAKPPVEELDAEGLVKVALMSARHHSRVRGLRYVSPEDIAQDTMATVLQARQRNASTVVTRAYVDRVTSGHVAIALRGTLRPEDRKAMGIYNRRVTELEDELGRRTSSQERKALATEIRDTWEDQRHKPSKDFVVLAEMRFVSLDRPIGDGEQTLGDIVAEQQGSSDDDIAVDADSALGQALIAATNGRKAEARRSAWTAIAESAGVADVAADSLSRQSAKTHKDALASAGGVREAVRDWNRNEDTPATAALFAPFGPDLSPDDKDDIVAVLVAHSAYAEDLHKEAMRAATR
ncbi:hypothetical protein [Pseudactinotalea terrae]|uniref:hypothetical protein n=1 Tax=Pseudactinotalea terrae TaxID=1743262 RepID=UPI0012E27D58|nr:hypothetical protein [Pseudactinotalea terrae]